MLIICPILFPLIGVVTIILLRRWECSDRSDRIKTLVYFGNTIVISFIIAGLIYWGGTSKTRFSEIGNYKMVRLMHEELWTTEERHEEEVTVGHDKDGNPITETRVYYTTETHGPYWTAYDEYGGSRSIDRRTYDEWSATWGNNTRTGEHDGSAAGFDTPITGGIYESKWPGSFGTIYPYEEIWTYQNKVRVCNSVFKYAEPSPELAKRYPRPADAGNTMPIISYGPTIHAEEQLYLRRVNAQLGRQYQVHLMIILFDATKNGQGVVNDVLSAWQGPNMNELILFMGLDASRKVVWVNAQSWMDNTTIHSKLQQRTCEIGTFDAVRLGQVFLDLVPTDWKRKDFKKDFDYLHVPIAFGWYLADILLTIGICIGAFFIIDRQEF